LKRLDVIHMKLLHRTTRQKLEGASWSFRSSSYEQFYFSGCNAVQTSQRIAWHHVPEDRDLLELTDGLTSTFLPVTRIILYITLITIETTWKKFSEQEFWRVLSLGMCDCVVRLLIDVSKEYTAFIFRVEYVLNKQLWRNNIRLLF
jgi:hypothetical protein